MPKEKIRRVPAEPTNPVLEKAHTIVRYAHDTAISLLERFDRACRTRGQGSPTTEEQDLLRAMLVMTGAGLDAMLKQIAHDALRDVLAKSVKAQKEFSQFAVREMSSEGEELQLKTIAEYLVSDSPRERLLKRWEEEITSRSMQSVEQIMTVAGYLGVEKPREVLTTNTKKIQDAFDVRNQIAHEMDIDFSHPVRKRRPRRREHMVDHVNALVSVCADILSHMDSTLK